MRKYLIAFSLFWAACGGMGLDEGASPYRNSIAEGGVPRPEEFSLAAFVSAHTYDFPAATTDMPVSVVGLTSFVADPKSHGPKALLLIGLDTQRTETVVRTPVDLVAVIDRSGSMEGDKITQTRTAVKKLARGLASGDRLAIVAYDSAPEALLGLTGNADLAVFDAVADGIVADGGTNIYGGLESGYALLPNGGERTRWVVLLSDGIPNQGETSPDAIARLVHSFQEQGIGTSAVAVGDDADRNLMARVAASGSGSYYFLSDPEKLADVFRRELTRVSTPVADDFSLSFHLTSRYTINEVYGFTLESGAAFPAFQVPRVFYQERPGAFLVDLTFNPGADTAADWGALEATYMPVGAAQPVTQSVPIGLPFDPQNNPEEEFFAHAASRKGYVALAAGMGIQTAVEKFWNDDDREGAKQAIDEAIAEFERRRKPLGDDKELTSDLALLQKLQANLDTYAKPATTP